MPTLDSVIRVTTEIADATSTAPSRFGGALIVTETDRDVLAASGEGKVASYTNLAAVSTAGFGATSQPYLAAAAYFGQNPSPSQVAIARWAKEHAPSEIIGGSHDPVATITATATRLVSGDQPAASTTLTVPSTPAIVGIGGDTNSVSPSTAAGSTAVATIASDLQTAFRGESFDGASDITVTIEGTGAASRFVINVPAGVSIRAGGLTGNLATLLGFVGSDNPRYEAPFTMSVDGTSATVNALLSTATGGTLLDTETLIAGAVQTALRAATPTGFSSLTVTHDATRSRFEISDGTTRGAVRTLTAAIGGLADAMGLSSDEGATVHGGDAGGESAADFLASVAALSYSWYWVFLESSVYGDSADAEDFSAAIENTRKQLLLETNDASVLTISGFEVTDEAAVAARRTAVGSHLRTTGSLDDSPGASPAVVQIAAQNRTRTSIIWSAEADYKAAALAGQFAARDLNRSNTAVTAKFRVLTGRSADTLTPAQVTSLDGQRINYYTEFGGAAILSEGVCTADGQFIETQYWVDWFAQEAQNEIFSLLQTSARVPQTAAGIAQLSDRVEDVCRLGIANGGIAPGTLSQAVTNSVRSTTGNPGFDGQLRTGYLIYVAPVSSLSPANRAAGQVPPIRVWLKGSGAVHLVDLDLTFGG